VATIGYVHLDQPTFLGNVELRKDINPHYHVAERCLDGAGCLPPTCLAIAGV
jgi:hypothetical protein